MARSGAADYEGLTRADELPEEIDEKSARET
jgi:hypothetical protein